MPRNTLNFSVQIYVGIDVSCSGLKVYVPINDVESLYPDMAFGGKYRKCDFSGEVTTETNQRCDFQCTCLITICQALFVLVPGAEKELCEVMFP